jgi:4-amino-4-deoxy-L-arabinose transferase-like glycosyltransferase
MSLADFVRPGRASSEDVRLDVLWLLGLVLALVATGIGLRDPWPADEPRFALIARDMVASGQWLIPQVGGDLYQDKPPLFFWAVGLFLLITGSLRVAFLLPSLLACIGCVLAVYDLARRLWSREVGLLAALALLFTAQFVWQARQAQIDAFLCLWTTLGLYGLLRHLLLGPAWGWYVVGWAAAGLGIISKGVGFLPLLVLLPYAVLRRRSEHAPKLNGGVWRWLMGPLALAAAVFVWLGPMLWVASGNEAVARYRDEILFDQTLDRYADAWHHHEPFWYFVVQVIPGLWLPMTALIPWLVPHWRESWRSRDLRVLLPLLWCVLVVLFFSLSSGKRGVYVLPALPGFVLASAPFLKLVLERRGVQRTLFGLACAIAVITLLASVYLLIVPERRQELIEQYDLDAFLPLLVIGGGIAVCCAWARVRRGVLAYAGAVAVSLWVVSFWVNPVMDPVRSGESFVRRVESMASDIEQLGLVAYKEQYLLNFRRRTFNFGHSRWREYGQEEADAAAWLAADPKRWLLVDQQAKDACFSRATVREVGRANRETWYLVTGWADPDCIARGNPKAARQYSSPKSYT